MILKKYTNRMILTISTLTILITNTPTKIKAYIPPIKGLYEIFTPDVIGIGQALKAKGWIENVYDFAPEDNLAKKVITSFWHKISENEQLKPTELAPVSEITPQILGQILKYIRTFENGNKEEREKIAAAWNSQCDDYIKNKLPYKVKNDIKKAIEELNKKNDENTKKIASNKNTEEIKSELKKSDSEIEKLKKIIKTLTKENQASEAEIKKTELKEKEESRTKNQLLLKEIEKAKKDNLDFQKKLKKFNDNNLQINEIEKKTSNIKNNTTKIIEEIEKLAASQDFIPETAEAILWAFFEDKFTSENQDESLINLLLFINPIDKKILNTIIPIKEYKEEYKNFENAIKNLHDIFKIDKIVKEYDLSTYSSITATRIKNLPPIIDSPKMEFQKNNMEFQYKNNKRSEYEFTTCFESAILDTLSILLYNPTNKTYDLTLLPDSSKSSEFFINIIDQVFKEKTDSGSLINPSIINTKFKNWINIIENKPGIEYFDKKNINDKTINYNLNTRIENLIKILNEFFNLGLEITDNHKDPKTLEINNFNKIIENPENAQDFLNKIFKFISKKLSTDDQKQINKNPRKITFSYELDSSRKPSIPNFEISENKVKISGSFGIINIKIEYPKFDINFDLHIESGHAYIKFPARDNIIMNYSNNFKERLGINCHGKEPGVHFYDKKNKQKLLPLFILLADLNILEKLTDLNILEKTDIKMQNLLFYCMPSKADQDKLKFMITIARKGLFEEQIFKKPIQQFIDKIFTNEQLKSNLLDSILYVKTKNKTIDIIIDQAIKKDPNYLLIKILDKTSIDWSENIAIQIINKNKNFYLNNPVKYRSILLDAISNKHKNIVELLSTKYPEDTLLQIMQDKLNEWTKNIALKIINDNPNLNFTKTDFFGNSILYYATKNGHKDIIEALSKLKTKNNHENKN